MDCQRADTLGIAHSEDTLKKTSIWEYEFSIQLRMKDDEWLAGVFATYSDYTLNGGNNTYVDFCKKTELKFKCKELVWDDSKLTCLKIATKNDIFLLHRRKYLKSFRNFPKAHPLRPSDHFTLNDLGQKTVGPIFAVLLRFSVK